VTSTTLPSNINRSEYILNVEYSTTIKIISVIKIRIIMVKS